MVTKTKKLVLSRYCRKCKRPTHQGLITNTSKVDVHQCLECKSVLSDPRSN